MEDKGRMVCYSREELPYSKMIIEGGGKKTMDDDILVVRVNMFLKNKEQEAVRQYILEQRKTGVIVLPPYCEAIMVPKDVEIKFEGVETNVD